MKASLIKQTVVEKHVTKTGVFTLYPNILICEFNEGIHVDFESAAFAIQLAQMSFGIEKPIIYISHRSHSYSWNPIHYNEIAALFPNLKALAIVSNNKRRRAIAKLERVIIKKPIAVFKTIDEAIEWAEEIL